MNSPVSLLFSMPSFTLPFPSTNSDLSWLFGLCLRDSDVDFLIGHKDPAILFSISHYLYQYFPKVFCRMFDYFFLFAYSCIRSSNKHLLSTCYVRCCYVRECQALGDQTSGSLAVNWRRHIVTRKPANM